MGIQELRQKYSKSLGAEGLKKQSQAFGRAYTEFQAGDKSDAATLVAMKELYEDANTIYNETTMEDAEKQKLLYPIYEAFYGNLAGLPWKKRRACQANKHIKAMSACLKKAQPASASLKYWVDFTKFACPFFVLFFILELLFFRLLRTGPAWLAGLALLGFLVFFTSYCLVTSQMEGKRLFGMLQKWIWFRASPKEQARPLDLLQGLKMLVPLLVALGGALIRMYVK